MAAGRQKLQLPPLSRFSRPALNNTAPDPFFFKISWHEDEEGGGEEREFGGFERLEIEGLKYEKLSFKKLKLERAGEEDEDDKHAGGKARAISRLLWRIIDSIEDEDE